MSADTTGLLTFVAVWGAVLGGLAALLGLLNLRDRREARLLQVAAAQVPPLMARSTIAIRAHCTLLSPRGTVVIDLWPCTADELWAVIVRLRRALPTSVRLSIEGEISRRFPARLTVDAVSRGGALAPLGVSQTAAC